jgi:hypothetical protein
MTELKQYITTVSNNQLTWYMEQNKTTQEETDYYDSEDYELHLNYLIDSWVSSIQNDFNNANFQDINKLFQDGFYWPEFEHQWLDDIFEHHILDTHLCLK